MKVFTTVLSAAACGLFALATPVAAQTVVRTSANNIVYSVDSLESTRQPEDVSLGEEVTPIDSLESNVSAPADKKSVMVLINGVPTSIVAPVAAPVSTPADMFVVQPSNPSVKVERSSSVDVVVPAVQPTAEPVSPLANTKVKTATPVAVPVVNPLVDVSPSAVKTVSEEAPTSVVIPVPAPRSLEIPSESRVGNPTSRSWKASPLVGKKVQNPTATQPTDLKVGSKVANFDIQAAQPFNTIVESKTVSNSLVGTEIPATQPSNLGVGSKVAIVNPAQPVTQSDSKAAANPLVSKPVQVKTATQPVSATGSKVAFNPVLNTGVMNGFTEKPKPVSPLADTKAKVCDPANLENSIKIRAPDRGPSETRVAAKYSRPCSKTTATLGYNANVDQSGKKTVDLEITQGIGDFEVTAKTNLKPAVTLQTAGIKWSKGQVTLEASRDFANPAWNGKVGIEMEVFKKQKDPDKILLEMGVHAPDGAALDGRVATTYTRKSSNTKAVLGANFSNTATSADLEITQGIGKNLEVTAKAGLLPAVQLQSLGAKLTRGGWSLEVKRDLLGQAWEGQVQYTIKF